MERGIGGCRVEWERKACCVWWSTSLGSSREDKENDGEIYYGNKNEGKDLSLTQGGRRGGGEGGGDVSLG